MTKRVLVIAGSLVAAILIFLAVRSIQYEHYPVHVDPSPEWEPRVSAMDATREKFFVESDGLQLEAELFIPNGGSESKGAVVFSPGSGDSLYQNYDGGLVETYVLGVFLPRDMAVLLVNKRGMGESEGSWVKNDFQGRADDLYAAVKSIQDHPSIDAERIGVIGHSQGGWIVTLTAAQHEDIAFFISLVGPTTSVEGNMADNYRGAYRCEGYADEELDRRVEQQLNASRTSASIGKVIPFGMFGFDAGIIGYDPYEALHTVTSPGLLVFAESDKLVDAERNTQLFYDMFDGNPPDHLTTVTIADATHGFHIVDDPCMSYEDSLQQPQSEELLGVLNDWLSEQGY